MPIENHSSAPRPESLRIKLLAVFFILLGISFWWFQKSLLSTPEGIAPFQNVELHQMQGPWFEVARLDSPIERDIHDPTIFIRFTGPGADSMFPTYDPADPRLRIMVAGRSEGTVYDEVTDQIDNFNGGRIVLPCYKFLKCAFYLIDFDTKGHTWMVIGGSRKNQLWVLSTWPGLMPNIMNPLKTRLAAKGYDTRNLIYSNAPPKLPEINPAVPDLLPALPPGITIKQDEAENPVDPGNDSNKPARAPEEAPPLQ